MTSIPGPPAKDNPGGDDDPELVLDWARRYVAGGISIFPMTRDGVGGWKAPDAKLLPLWPDPATGKPRRSWNGFREKLPTDEDLVRWYGVPKPPGIAVVCGAVSGGLELLDFDNEAEATFAAWCALVMETDPALPEKVAVVRSPRGGYHVWLRSEERPVPGNKVLAANPAEPDAKKRKLIETRGEGGYGAAEGSPPECHETGRPYKRLEGPRLWDLPTLTADERDTLMSAARLLERTPPPPPPRMPRQSAPGDGLRPGDDFDARGDWEAEVLGPAGWTVWRDVGGGEVRWTHPGKEKGTSATTGFCKDDKGNELMKVFTSSADPLEAGKAYGKFNAYTLLYHGGDHSAAAKALREKGYGSPASPSPPRADLPARTAARPRPALAPPVEPWVPMPLNALPRPLADLAREGARATGCDPAFIVLPGLAVLAGSTGNSRALQLKRTWYEHPILWTLPIGESGALKTAGYLLPMRPLWEMEAEWRRAHESAMRGFEAEADERKEACRQAKGGPKPSPPERPVLRRAVVEDITIERLGEVLADNPRGLLVARDELNGWLGSFTRYRSGGGTDLANWLQLHRCGVLKVDRKTAERKTIIVPNASVSVTGGIQPGVLARALDSNHWDSGFAARLLLAMPPRRRKEWTDDDVPDATLENWSRTVRWLLGLRMYNAPEGLRPNRVKLSGEARSLWVDWYNEWADEQFEAQGELAAAYAKLEAAAARLALVHHCATLAYLECDDLREVSAESMAAGIELARWFAREARRCYAVARATDDQRPAMRLVEWIRQRGGSVTSRDLYDNRRTCYPRPEDAEAALEALATAGLGAWQDVPAGPKGGRPTRRLVIQDPRPHNRTTAQPEFPRKQQARRGRYRVVRGFRGTAPGRPRDPPAGVVRLCGCAVGEVRGGPAGRRSRDEGAGVRGRQTGGHRP